MLFALIALGVAVVGLILMLFAGDIPLLRGLLGEEPAEQEPETPQPLPVREVDPDFARSVRDGFTTLVNWGPDLRRPSLDRIPPPRREEP